ncbi:R-spondin-2 [Microtus ochrogaster]|uniref:R-spondin-2 n=1 Tax=Microtus ochrogaster TaxID=79684 RepID=A0A8J6FZY5_MICOH|nr:R-spondin-2 [Microtus ochrogaster]
MRFRLFSFALIILNCMDYSQCQGNRWRRNKRASYVSNPICKGCLSCSKDNGCSRCQQKLFFFLRREGMRQYGECLHSCPSGYYGHRAPDMNRCATSYVSNPICKGCLSCSKDNGCSRCQQKLFFFLRREGMRQYGECLHSCPSGYYGHRAPDMNRCARCRIENCDSCFSKDFCTKCKVGFYLHRGRCFDECPDGFAPLDETMECVAHSAQGSSAVRLLLPSTHLHVFDTSLPSN